MVRIEYSQNHITWYVDTDFKSNDLREAVKYCYAARGDKDFVHRVVVDDYMIVYYSKVDRVWKVNFKGS
jgi:hypothetical protein